MMTYSESLKHSKPREQTAQAHDADSALVRSFISRNLGKLHVNCGVWKLFIYCLEISSLRTKPRPA